MVEKNKKHSIQQDVSTKEQEPLTDLESSRLGLLRKIELLSGKSDCIEDKISRLYSKQRLIEAELKKNIDFISEEIVKKYTRPDLP